LPFQKYVIRIIDYYEISEINPVIIDPTSFERILDHLNDGLYIVDQERKVLYWNQAAERISGFSADEVVGKHCHDNILNHVDSDGRQLCFTGCPLGATIQDGERREGEIYMHHKAGHRVPVSVRVSQLTDSAGTVIGGIELFTDISNRAASELRVKELEKLALLDPLTQLANRTHLDNEIEIRIEENRRYRVPFGVLFIDIDYFKDLNDTHGHSRGDEVLRFAGRTFAANSRPFDLYGRWGGEEFLGLIRSITEKELKLLGNRIRTLIEQSFVLHGKEKLQVTISIGATLVKDGDDAKSLIHRADMLMYQSKEAGRNCLTFG